MSNDDLGEKVAVITGGASRIALACSHTMARSSADVAIWDLDQDGARRGPSRSSGPVR